MSGSPSWVRDTDGPHFAGLRAGRRIETLVSEMFNNK